MQKKWIRNSVFFIGIAIFTYVVIKLVLLADPSEPTEVTAMSKSTLPAFNTPETLAIQLSDNGIGALTSWKGYDEGIYLSSSDYFQTGAAGKNGISNQLSYAMMGSSKDHVSYVEIILLVNNKEELNKALALFDTVAVETFKDINVAIPDGLAEAIQKPQKFSYDAAGIHVTLREKWNGLPEWHLTLSAKEAGL